MSFQALFETELGPCARKGLPPSTTRSSLTQASSPTPPSLDPSFLSRSHPSSVPPGQSHSQLAIMPAARLERAGRPCGDGQLRIRPSVLRPLSRDGGEIQRAISDGRWENRNGRKEERERGERERDSRANGRASSSPLRSPPSPVPLFPCRVSPLAMHCMRPFRSFLTPTHSRSGMERQTPKMLSRPTTRQGNGKEGGPPFRRRKGESVRFSPDSGNGKKVARLRISFRGGEPGEEREPGRDSMREGEMEWMEGTPFQGFSISRSVQISPFPLPASDSRVRTP